MDSQEIENLLAGPLGVQMGKRGDVNDSDAVRRHDPKLLVKALTKILPLLAKRAEGMKESESKAWIENSLRDFDDMKDKLTERNYEVKGLALFLLWGACATALNGIHLQLKTQGL